MADEKKSNDGSNASETKPSSPSKKNVAEMVGELEIPMWQKKSLEARLAAHGIVRTGVISEADFKKHLDVAISGRV